MQGLLKQILYLVRVHLTQGIIKHNFINIVGSIIDLIPCKKLLEDLFKLHLQTEVNVTS